MGLTHQLTTLSSHFTERILLLTQLRSLSRDSQIGLADWWGLEAGQWKNRHNFPKSLIPQGPCLEEVGRV